MSENELSRNEPAEDKLSDEVAAVEAALGSLRPATSALDRDRAMYLAGRAAAAAGQPTPGPRPRPFTWLWPAATAASLLVAATLGAVLIGRGQPQPVERVVYVKVAEPALPALATIATRPGIAPDRDRQLQTRHDYFELRRVVLSEGIDAIETSGAGTSAERKGPVEPSSYRAMLREFLDG